MGNRDRNEGGSRKGTKKGQHVEITVSNGTNGTIGTNLDTNGTHSTNGTACLHQIYVGMVEAGRKWHKQHKSRHKWHKRHFNDTNSKIPINGTNGTNKVLSSTVDRFQSVICI